MNTLTATILLVDDNKADQTTIKRTLEDSEIEYSLITAQNGRDALDLLQQLEQINELPDLVLMDINMPVMDGKQALHSIKSADELKHIPVVMFTTSIRDKDIKESYRLGANACVNKPLEKEQFVRTINQITHFWFELVKYPS